MTTHVNQRLFAQSRLAQADYATPRAFGAGPPKTYRQIVSTDQNFADYQVNSADNTGHATGQDWPTDQWIDRHDVTQTIPEQVCSQEIGRALYDAFGGLVTDQPAAIPSPATYRHTFTPQSAATSRQLPVRSYVETIASEHDVLFPSMATEQLTLQGDGTGRLTVSRTLRGSGKRTTPSGVTWATHVDDLTGSVDYLYNSQVTLNVDDGASPIAYGCRYESFTVNINNQLLAEAGYRPGCATYQTSVNRESGMIRQELLFGARSYDLDFVVRLASGGAEYAALQAQTPLEIIVTAEGGIIEDAFTHKLTVTIPLTKYQTVQLSNSDGIMTLQIKAKVLFDVSTGEIIEVELINDVASYTV